MTGLALSALVDAGWRVFACPFWNSSSGSHDGVRHLHHAFRSDRGHQLLIEFRLQSTKLGGAVPEFGKLRENGIQPLGQRLQFLLLHLGELERLIEGERARRKTEALTFGLDV